MQIKWVARLLLHWGLGLMWKANNITLLLLWINSEKLLMEYFIKWLLSGHNLLDDVYVYTTISSSCTSGDPHINSKDSDVSFYFTQLCVYVISCAKKYNCLGCEENKKALQSQFCKRVCVTLCSCLEFLICWPAYPLIRFRALLKDFHCVEILMMSANAAKVKWPLIWSIPDPPPKKNK